MKLIKESHKTLKDFLPKEKNQSEVKNLSAYLLDCAVIALNHPLNLENYLKPFRPVFIHSDLMREVSFYSRYAIANYHIEKSRGMIEKVDMKNVAMQISSYNYLIAKLTYELFEELNDPEEPLSYMLDVDVVDKDRYKKRKLEAEDNAKDGLYEFVSKDISKALDKRIFRFLSDAYLYSMHIPMRKEMDWCNTQFSDRCQGKEICYQLQKALEAFFIQYNAGEKDLDDLNRIQKEIGMVNELLKNLIRDIYVRGEYCRYDYDDLQIGHHIENINFVLEKGLLHFIPAPNGGEAYEKVNALLKLAYQFDLYLEKEEDWEAFKESLMEDFSYYPISKLLNEGYERFYVSYRQKDVFKNSIELVSHQVRLLNRMLKFAYFELCQEGYSVALPYEKVKIKERI